MSVSKQFILFLFSFLYYIALYSQTEEAYLVFEENATSVCALSMYRDGSDKNEVTFNFKRENVNGKNRFSICRQIFESEQTKGKKVSGKKIRELKIESIDELLIKIESDWPKINKANAYKNIYILEKQKDGYMKYKVKWLD